MVDRLVVGSVMGEHERYINRLLAAMKTVIELRVPLVFDLVQTTI